MKFNFHRDALAEYKDAAHYYAAVEPELALRFIDAVEHAISLIIEAPERWRDIDDGIRRCFTRVFPFAVLYSIETDHVLIVAVMHCSREPGYWQHRTLTKSAE